MLAILVQLVDKRLVLVEREAVRIICEAFVAVHVVDIIPHGVQWDLGLLEVGHNFFCHAHIPIAPSALVEPCHYAIKGLQSQSQ